MLTEAIKHTLIQAAIHAPSADNSQPFQYQWQSDAILSLFIDPERSGKASDNRFVLSDIALGAVIENIVIAANASGFTTKETYLPDDENEYHVCDISFDDDGEISNDALILSDYIVKRATDRRFPFKGPIHQETLSTLSKTGQKYGCHVKWYTNKQEKKSVLPVIQKAESIRFKSETLHRELFSTVHFNQPESEEGMPIEVLAIEKPAQPMFKQMKKWSVMNFFNKLGAYKMLGIRSVKLPILFSPCLSLITIEDNSRTSVINGGRALQRLWLKCTELGVAVQPYAAPGIFSLGFVNCEPEFDKPLADVGQEMKSVVNSDGYGLMFLRLGYSKPMNVKTNRRKLESFEKSD